MEKYLKRFVSRETVSYIFFGVLTTAIDWGVYRILTYIMKLDYKTAFVLSAASAIIFAFVTNKLFVFHSRRDTLGELFREFISFVSCRVFTLVFTFFAMIVFVDVYGINDFLSKIIISAISLFLNYVLSKIFIFRKHKE